MRVFWIALTLFVGCMICIGCVVNLVLEQSLTVSNQKQEIADLKGKLKEGNGRITMADSVIKANTIYVGPQIHDTVYLYKDTVYIYRWLNDRKFKHAK